MSGLEKVFHLSCSTLKQRKTLLQTKEVKFFLNLSIDFVVTIQETSSPMTPKNVI